MKAIDLNVLDFISGRNKVFVIPPFQRNYEWNIQQCEELFDDLIFAYRNNKSHYLGNVVYYVGENNSASFQELILIDGQQRITSILLLLCALRDSTNNEQTIQDIETDCLKNRTQNEKYRMKLKQTAYDADCFAGIINGTEIKEKNNNTYKNYEYFKKRVKDCGVSVEDLYNTIIKLEIVDVNLQIDDDLSKVQTVFEKINSTGKRLEPADLIRNYLLLANTTAEQDYLYSEFWLKIENKIKNAYISRFAKDYLILNIFTDVSKEHMYKTFRRYFDSNGISHVSILKDMLRLSKYYEWLIYENCPNAIVNRIIKQLNTLKTNDLYPLYLYIFDKLFNKNNIELIKILRLLSDFMLRYRVVTPSNGGGALRSAVYNLLELLNSEDIKLTYDDILFELSNSSTPSSRFPDNLEFKNCLMEYIDIPYAKVAYLKLEEFETKNIPVELDFVTMEHLMPQTKTEWWINNFGGSLETDKIYEKYLNCVGNLAPISQGYNSKNSNKPWTQKINNLKQVQFVVTSEIANYKEWKEEELIHRNNNIADRLCVAITSPLDRTRTYQSKNKVSEINGVYPLADENVSITGSSIKYLIYNEEVIIVNAWRDLLLETCKILYNYDTELFNKILENNLIHKATSSKNYPDKDPVITLDKNKLITAQELDNTGIYIESCLSADRARYYANQIAEKFGLADKFSIEIILNN